MKRAFLLFGTAAIFTISISSCAAGHSMKRDCQGNKHVRLKNGVWM